MQAFWRVVSVLVFMGVVAAAAWEPATDPQAREAAPLPVTADSPQQPDLRVLVLDGADAAQLVVRGRARVDAVLPDSSAQAYEVPEPGAYDLRPVAGGLRFGSFSFIHARVTPLGEQPLRLRWDTVDGDGHPVKRDIALNHPIELRRTAARDAKGQIEAKLQGILWIPVEDYLPGVLKGEVGSADWPMEALRAQAVAARSYAIYHAQLRARLAWDVTADVSSQVWESGFAGERRVRAARSTAGLVLVTERGQLFNTYFHAKCGGATADAHLVFGVARVTPLTGVRCPRCSNPARREDEWTFAVTRAEIAQRLRDYRFVIDRKPGASLGTPPLASGDTVISVTPLGPYGSARRPSSRNDIPGVPLPAGQMGRAIWFQINLAGKAPVVVPGDLFRKAVGCGAREMRSTWVRVDNDDPLNSDVVTFHGKGFGHGVGMCQHGSEFMASEQKHGYEAILRWYYPGATMVRLWDAP